MKRILASGIALALYVLPVQADAACNNPAGVEGEIIYNSNHKVMQFCDNEHWIAMAAPEENTGITDGDKGDITVSGSGAVWTVKSSALRAAGNTGEIQFKGTDNGNAADGALTWDNTNKRLGVGTATPRSLLDVRGGVISMDSHLASNTYWDAAASTWRGIAAGYGGVMQFDRTTGRFYFWASSANVASPDAAMSMHSSLVLNANGNIGIGTAVPDALLDLHHNGTEPAALRIGDKNNAASETGIYLRSTSHARIAVGTGANLSFHRGGPLGTELMRISADGNVGIGKANPTSKLDIAGSMNLVGNITGGSGGGAHNFHIDAYDSGIGTRGLYLNYYTGTGVYLAGGTAVTSDLRKKKDIETLTGALDKIAKIRGVSYRWKDPERSQERQLGVVAQEVQKIFPDLVKEDGYGALTVVYDGLTAPMIEAIKELKAENDALHATNNEFRARIEALEKAMAK